jgi:outer membrane protein TolC
MRTQRVLLLMLTGLVFSASALHAGQAADVPPSPLSLKDAVNFALTHHPTLRADAARNEVADANLDIARDQLIPRGDIGLQENRATGNVVPGSTYSLPGIPNVSGPPTDRVFDSGVWGSTAGLSAWWDVAHLTQQMRLVDAALAERSGAQAGYAAGELAIAFDAADSFARVVEAEKQVDAGKTNVDRAKTLETTVGAMVRSGLRPGADGARAAAEVALAQTQLIRAEQARDLSQASLAEALGAAGEHIVVTPGRLGEQPPAPGVALRASVRNPLITAADDAATAEHDRRRAAVLEYIPRIDIVAALWGRGSGLFPGGANLRFGQGVVPDTPNWASGVVITIPIFEYPEIRARVARAAANARLADANRDVVIQQVQAQIDSANAILTSAYRAADQSRISLQSSHAALTQAQARYRAGLYTIDAVAEALRLVADAEAGDAIARTDIWRARMLLARAVGDLGPLLSEISQASGAP